MVATHSEPVLRMATERTEEAQKVLKKEFGASSAGNRIRIQRPDL